MYIERLKHFLKNYVVPICINITMKHNILQLIYINKNKILELTM